MASPDKPLQIDIPVKLDDVKAVFSVAAYRYISVLTLREGKVAHWRDYLDPVAVFDALGWPPR